MASVAELLRDLYLPEQLQALDRVRGEMLNDPTIFDNHSRHVRTDAEQEKRDGKA
jgi:hypothetical protein